MKKSKKITISLALILSLSLILSSCIPRNHLRPIGTYISEVRVFDADAGVEKTTEWRFLIKFIQEEVSEKTGVRGKVDYAFQTRYLREGTNAQWRTTAIYKDAGLEYKTINPNSNSKKEVDAERIEIDKPDKQGVLRSFNYMDHAYFNAGIYGGPLINKVDTKEYERKDGIFNVYKLTKTDIPFPTKNNPIP